MASLARQLLGVAVVTGTGGTGIGAVVARGFARSGCTRIAITDINPKTLSQIKDAILSNNPSAKVFDRPGNISDENFIDSFHDEVFGRKTLKAVEMETNAFDKLNGINYRGSWLSCRAQLRNMLKQDPLEEQLKQRGAIVNIASQLGIVARTSAAACCASKAAIINMTRSNAIDYSGNGIRVNCVCLGVIETPITTTSPEMVEALKPAIKIAPMQRMGTPDEVADAVLFLCSTQASFIQGHALVVDGEYTIN
ncbi:short-chain dehydrogenase/reductase-like protein SDR [Bimuria novae-zelandiae CBS 107.79]|uniref:Short-chain dehydrogenase/reductase-like protein SDR n=1 Tax=Bimuria novae-zelandiae CBS 107.79 TaxID=1447943 RepID=A0A6A5VBL5_9PLEO|nr:short-chain dehydrogenase/reductase-like protein SDR [Bimuria novae-zelandiae CBS 107.79]